MSQTQNPNTDPSRCTSGILKAEFLSPKFLLTRAMLILVVFGIIHMAGWRAHTTLLSGTISTAGMTWEGTALRGVIYLLFYFGTVLAAPIFIISGLILGFFVPKRNGKN